MDNVGRLDRGDGVELAWAERSGIGPTLVFLPGFKSDMNGSKALDLAEFCAERGSILLTSNRAPNEWPDLFLDPLLASAGLDRLLDRSEVIIIRGASYRAKGRARLTEEVPPPQKQP